MNFKGQVASPVRYPDGSMRRHPRTLFTVPITLRHLMSGGIRTFRGVSLDISETGIGALVDGSLQIGDTVQIELKLSECHLQTVAIVRHSSTVRSGFEFLGLTPEERAQLASAIGNA